MKKPYRICPYCSGMFTWWELRDLRFESSVNSYGRQTYVERIFSAGSFESSVNSYGRQTKFIHTASTYWFESSVNSYGRQTLSECITDG